MHYTVTMKRCNRSLEQTKETASLAGERLAISIKKKCTIEQQENGMEIRKLKLKELSTYSDSKASSFKRFSLGERNPMEWNTSKTILLMGETGAGKTTMINAMINYVLGVEWGDDFRFKLVDEQVRKNQAHSQTQVITAYEIHHQEGFRIPFSLTIVDTPGFNSTDGLESDQEIPKAIENFFRDKNGIRLSDMPTKSLQMTQQVLETRKRLEILLDHGLKDISSKLFKVEHLRKMDKIIAQNKDKFVTNGDKKIEMPKLIKRKVAVDEKSALNCTKCEETCHYPCKRIPLTMPFCPAFFGSRRVSSILDKILQLEYDSTSWKSLVYSTFVNVSSLFSVTCFVCPGQCSMSDHKNETTRWELIEINVLRALRDIGKDYKDAEGNPLSVQGIHHKLKDDVDQLEKNILHVTSEITKYSNGLKKIALRGDPLLTMPEYIDMMIKNEEKYPKKGYEKRIESLKNILNKAKLCAGEKTTFE
uniref:Septin-type G domain-containing protein n=1 Tax=Daphnia galeata TaxID=27404 RepID=A0A8J2RXJ9_9CRUS|nr:unnamed protein product [Daphnia galeata]